MAADMAAVERLLSSSFHISTTKLMLSRRCGVPQLKPIVGQYARTIFGVVGAEAFCQECSLLSEKERMFMQHLLVATAE